MELGKPIYVMFVAMRPVSYDNVVSSQHALLLGDVIKDLKLDL